MGQDTAIEWCDDTANFWEGCTQISPACDFCYAKARAERYHSVEWNGPPRHVKSGVANLRAINRRAMRERRVRLVFINSLSDTFDKLADPAWRREMFDTIKECPWIVALILTKRIGNAVEMSQGAGGFPRNAALGITVIDQTEVDRDLGKLTHAWRALGRPLAFLSMEPLLGPVTLPRSPPDCLAAIIVGGESGREARPMHPDWVRAIRDWCVETGVAFHFKQWGEWVAGSIIADPEWDGGARVHVDGFGVTAISCARRLDEAYAAIKVGKKLAARKLDGCTHDDFLPIDRSRAVAA